MVRMVAKGVEGGFQGTEERLPSVVAVALCAARRECAGSLVDKRCLVVRMRKAYS